MQSRAGGLRISPAIPTVANLALAALWACTALAGWGEQAFCGDIGHREPGCADGFGVAVLASLVLAVPAAAVAVAAWALPGTRRNAARLEAVLTLTALMWVAAEGILFVGGSLAQR
ncbi:hypothetical protein [Thermomonospora cellulosilytica]|uniref:Uncharacterized protein n=1 Tax=Thermomonospora cellulosilytica TaxID=1411118 RepID=A0A7W3R857_9ACTN|nr:hypothetical protein [Thermomonospora cellulosilytica]MBA9003347.1 hypothetical protein [Thermomonospora cellulosilytica]